MADDAHRLRLAYIANGVEFGSEGFDLRKCFALMLEEIDLFESGVVVNENHEVEEAVLRSLERSGKVAVDEAPDMYM